MGTPYPMSPGHEIVGTIASAGANVGNDWKQGALVGVGWNGGYCTRCQPCRLGDFTACQNSKVTGVNKDGGHQEYVIAHWTALVKMPENSGISNAELAPLLCAGNTVWEALHASPARAGDVVVVSGLGGLGHLALQYARKMGFIVVAVSGSKDKADLAKKLGAHYYFSAEDDVAAEVGKLGGAKAAIATAPSAKAISSLVPLLSRYGEVIVVGVPGDGNLEVSAMALVSKRAALRGYSCGASAENEKTIKFSVAEDVKAMVHKFPLDKANDALDGVLNGKPKFRVSCLDIG
ncbi:zinc-type alcohol dehydrogenase [Ceraceosorus guamensis]|uniref:Zinc-type alcohol dehydrogenase n=1 Tax=Ceraceosorus guamensis TaxID=1522189 RepID=A0A316W5G8_9BASI|nr:zinc-type alcohol dehydrogenase [Ceraceosorus guamensis]PWN45107.1 zinc-type alcohol dehydrogenase [Ceraceosorus guamensis]